MCLLYGNAFGQKLVLKWLLAFFVAFLDSAFIIEPLKVMIVAVVITMMTGSVDEVEEERLVTQPVLEMNEKIKVTTQSMPN